MSEGILKALKTVCLENLKEKLYIANSEKISKMIIQLFMSDFYPSIHQDTTLENLYMSALKISEEKERTLKEKQFEKMIEIQKTVRKYSKSGEPGWKDIETNPSVILTA